VSPVDPISAIVGMLGWIADGIVWFAATFVSSALTFAEKLSFGITHSEWLLYTVILCAVFIAANFVRRGFRLRWSPLAVKGTLATLAIVVVNGFFAPFVITLAKAFQHAYDRLGIPQVDADFWSAMPAWVVVPFAIFAYDLVNYWGHRAMHTRWLWPMHAIHHSDPELTAFTTFRVHAFETLFGLGAFTLLLTWLGLPEDVLGGAAILLGLHNSYQHMDLDWGHGPFRLVIASPRYHRWHHADTPEAYGKNLANVFPFLDVLFGTYHVPGRCEHPVGAKGVPKNDVTKLMLFPLVEWLRMGRAEFARLLRGARWHLVRPTLARDRADLLPIGRTALDTEHRNS
jgi:sterol desaturase/sphingolipid hydroxylase (fatty acid hydroxylase superfamily)